MLDTALTTCEAAAVAGVTRGTILRWIKLGYFGDGVRKQSVTRGNNCGYKIEISSLNKCLYRRHFGRNKLSKETYETFDDINILVSDPSKLKAIRKKLIRTIERAQAELDRIEALL